MKNEITVGQYLDLKHNETILFNGLQSVMNENNVNLVLPAVEQLVEVRKEIKRIEKSLRGTQKTAA